MPIDVPTSAKVKLHKLSKSKDILAFKKQGASDECITTAFFHILIKNNQLGYSRMNVLVPKKIISKATGRNSFKRIIKECIRRSFASKPFYQLDILVIARKYAKTVSKKDLNEAINQAIMKLQKQYN